MKNTIILFALTMVFAFTAEAQTNKQVAGSKSMEVLLAPLGGSPISISGIKYRAFSTESSAFRVTAFIGMTSETTLGTGTNEDFESVDLTDKAGSLNISVRPGIEMHLPGTDKLSPYYGGEALIAYGSTKNVDEQSEASDKVVEVTTKNSNIAFGLNAIGGMDYYFAQNIFFGAEMGFGFQLQSDGPTKVDSTADGAENVSTDNGGSFNVGPNAVGQLRFGIIF